MERDKGELRENSQIQNETSFSLDGTVKSTVFYSLALPPGKMNSIFIF